MDDLTSSSSTDQSRFGTTDAPGAPRATEPTRSSSTDEVPLAGTGPSPSQPTDAGDGSGAPGARGAAADSAPTDGPLSLLTCPSCGKKNKIRPSPRGTPHCGSCGAKLPWLVTATDETFDREAQAAVAVLVDLWAPWCGPCRFVGPIVEQLAQEYAGRLKVLKVNVDENPQTARRFQAFSIPTLVVLKDGRVVDRVVGALPKSQLTVRLTPHLLRR